MSGHSKWATIKRKKEKTDANRGKIFTKIGRELAIAVREGGPDPANNAKLRDVIAKAKAANLPNENIQRSIKKAAGEDASVQYEEILYEGYALGGIAVIVEALTDNRKRTAGEMRHTFDKLGGSLGSTGCVSYMFDRKGVIVIERDAKHDEDELMMLALEAGAEDFITLDDEYEVYTEVSGFSAVRDALEGAGANFISAEIARLPQTMANASDEQIQKLITLIERLDDNDDVQSVYHNAILPESEDDE